MSHYLYDVTFFRNMSHLDAAIRAAKMLEALEYAYGFGFDPNTEPCLTIRAAVEFAHLGQYYPMPNNSNLVTALQSIASGSGLYGAQDGEYKQIARDALDAAGVPYVKGRGE